MGALGGNIEAVKPDQCRVDLFGFKADGSEFAAKPVKLRAGIALPVIFVNVHEYFKHGFNITQLKPGV